MGVSRQCQLSAPAQGSSWAWPGPSTGRNRRCSQTQRGQSPAWKHPGHSYTYRTPLTHALLLQRNTQHKANNYSPRGAHNKQPQPAWPWDSSGSGYTSSHNSLETKSTEKPGESSTQTAREQRQDTTERGKPRPNTTLVFILLHISVKII